QIVPHRHLANFVSNRDTTRGLYQIGCRLVKKLQMRLVGPPGGGVPTSVQIERKRTHAVRWSEIWTGQQSRWAFFTSLQKSSITDLYYFIRQRLHILLIVRDQQCRDTLLANRFADKLACRSPQFRIQCGKRLIKK